MELHKEKTRNNAELDKFIHGSVDTIQTLFSKYENDDYMISKIFSYVNTQLPNIIGFVVV